jgi:sugar phosphate isomerase/epimerase
MGLCLSTAWNAFRYNNGKRIVQEIRGLGFEELELSFNLTKKIVEDIARLVKKKQIRVNSLHNFCPIPDGLQRIEALPDCYSLSSSEEEIRALAVKYTKVSIDTAVKLNAKAVVLHCGRVETADHTRDLISAYTHDGFRGADFQALKDRMRKERIEKAEAYFSNALRSLEQLADYAKGLDIAIGIENRYYYREIPSFEETGMILEHFRGAPIFYWHDTGHAQLWENLGFMKHKDYLDKYAPYLLGVHLHDIKGARDHLAPLKGDFDFNTLKPYLKDATMKTLEAHHPATRDELIRAKDYLEKLYATD